MSILRIRTDGDPVLRKKCRKVERIDALVVNLLDDMAETMYAAPGVGLAAPQIGINKRLVVADTGEGLLQLVNPSVISQEGSEIASEGCLSVPGKIGDVERAEKIMVKATMPDGKNVKIEADGYLARCLQHEIDHLDGILYIDKAENIREPEYSEDEEEYDEECCGCEDCEGDCEDCGDECDCESCGCGEHENPRKPAIFEIKKEEN